MRVPQADFKETIEAAGLAVTMVVSHTVVVSIIIGCTFLVEQYILWLWNGREPSVVGVPISEVVLGADFVILIAYLTTASIRAALAFWR
jgi:hypothetical protein